MVENNGTESCDVAVIGDGLVGQALAQLLVKNGWRVAHFCRRLEPRDTGLSLSLNLSSQRMLMEAGIYQHIPADAFGWFDRVRIWDSNDNQLDFSDETSMPGCIIPQQELLQAMKAAASRAATITRVTDTIKRVAAGHAEIETTTGKKWRAQLIIAADGADSRARSEAGISWQSRFYRQNALVCPVRCEKKHERIARQIFLLSGPLALLPQADENHCFIVWSTTPRETDFLQKLSPDAFARKLKTASHDVLGDMCLTGDRKIWPLRRLEADDYFRHRLVLVGDAAHVPHPLAGIGANMGLMDAACLASILTHAASRGLDIGSRRVLRSYERRRRPINRLALTAMDTIKYAFAARTPLLRSVRRYGLSGLAASPPCQRLLARAAAGLYDDWPRRPATGERPGGRDDFNSRRMVGSF